MSLQLSTVGKAGAVQRCGCRHRGAGGLQGALRGAVDICHCKSCGVKLPVKNILQTVSSDKDTERAFKPSSEHLESDNVCCGAGWEVITAFLGLTLETSFKGSNPGTEGLHMLSPVHRKQQKPLVRVTQGILCWATGQHATPANPPKRTPLLVEEIHVTNENTCTFASGTEWS